MEYRPDYWPPYEVKVEVDGNEDDTIYMVVHELVHVVFGPFLSPLMNGVLEEAMIVGESRLLSEYIQAKPARKKKWDDLIAKKFAETAPKGSTSMMEQVDHVKEKG